MAESRIIKRNVLFWGKSGLQLTGIMLIFMVVYGFLFNMGSGSIFGDFWIMKDWCVKKTVRSE